VDSKSPNGYLLFGNQTDKSCNP